MFVLAQAEESSSGLGAGAVIAIVVVSLVLVVLQIAGFWKTLEKGGESGPMSLLLLITCLYPIAFLPFTRLTGRPGWWVVLLYIPIVNLVVLLILSIDIAKAYGKGAGYGVGLWLLPFVFYPMLGFGDARYEGRSIV
jgi:uncharacterized membrane protein YhaH (DUF805 family)